MCRHNCICSCRKPYSFWNFLWDVTLVALTGGLWLIWVLIREAQR